jgi:hypothetical protein
MLYCSAIFLCVSLLEGWITQFPEFALALHYLAVRACDDVVWVDALDVLTSRHRLVFGAYLAT